MTYSQILVFDYFLEVKKKPINKRVSFPGALGSSLIFLGRGFDILAHAKNVMGHVSLIC